MSEQVSSERAMHSLHLHKLRAMFEHMLDGFAYCRMVYDASGAPVDWVYVDINPMFTELSGMTREMVIGRQVTHVIPGIEHDPADWIGRYGEVVRTQRPVRFENHSAVLNRWFRVSAYSPEPEHFAMIFEDISERKADERHQAHLIVDLERKNRELEEFLDTASHDLREPLITVRAFAETVTNDMPAGDRGALQTDMGRICAAAERMRARIDHVVRFTQLGRPVVDPEDLPLNALCATAARQITEPLTVIATPDMPTVRGDRGRLVEVFVELMANAVKFGAKQITVTAEVEGQLVSCRLVDDGAGIDPRYHGQLFRLFGQLDPHVPGSGVGLASVRRVVEVHGGTVQVESSGGPGTEFVLRLPRARGEDER